MSAAPLWSQIAERGSLFGLRVVVACYRLFGRSLSLVLVHAIVLYYFLTLPGARRASRAYLRRVAARPEGAAALGRPPGTLASFLHFRAFALSIFDRIVLWLGRNGELHFEVSGTEELWRLLRPDRGAVVVSSHLGSFEALRALAERDDMVVNVLMFTAIAPRLNAILKKLSPRAQIRLIETDPESFDTTLLIRQCIGRGEIVAMLGDRVEPGDRGRTCQVPFLGDPVAVPEAPYLMAGLLGCPVVFMVALRSGAGRYQVFAEILSEAVKFPSGERDKVVRELATAYAGQLERYCLRSPYQWFNFFDFWNDRPGGPGPG